MLKLKAILSREEYRKSVDNKRFIFDLSSKQIELIGDSNTQRRQTDHWNKIKGYLCFNTFFIGYWYFSDLSRKMWNAN